MTDARLPERYLMDRRVIRLSDADFRSFVMATLWSVSNRTDGEVANDDLALIPGFVGTAATSLEVAGLWSAHRNGWTIIDYDNTQTSKHDLEVLDNARRADREKKRRQRADRKSDGPSFSPSPGDDPGDVSRGTTQDRTGQARQGQAEYLGDSGNDKFEVLNHHTGEVHEPVTDWAVVQIPTSTPAEANLKSDLPAVCMVCSNSLVSATAQASGLCRKGDEAHALARARVAA